MLAKNKHAPATDQLLQRGEGTAAAPPRAAAPVRALPGGTRRFSFRHDSIRRRVFDSTIECRGYDMTTIKILTPPITGIYMAVSFMRRRRAADSVTAAGKGRRCGAGTCDIRGVRVALNVVTVGTGNSSRPAYFAVVGTDLRMRPEAAWWENIRMPLKNHGTKTALAGEGAT